MIFNSVLLLIVLVVVVGVLLLGVVGLGLEVWLGVVVGVVLFGSDTDVFFFPVVFADFILFRLI